MSKKPQTTPEDMSADALLYGSAFTITTADGTFERVSPADLSKEHLDFIQEHGWGIGRRKEISLADAKKLYPSR